MTPPSHEFVSPRLPFTRGGYTAFHTPIGLYKWDVLPQGTAASPQIFQRNMDKWFSAYLWKSVIVWMDDLLVHSTSFTEHLCHLEQVFIVVKRYGLVFNRDKVKLCQRSVRYIGYIFGVDGIKTDPDKLSAVHTMPAPTNPKQVRQFLGFAGFYRRFMPPTYANIIAPLTELTKKDFKFAWTPACQNAFKRVKLLLTTTPVLAHPDFSKPFHVHCDASGKGIGAVLSQYIDGAYRPIAFCSKRLLPHQVHWAPAQLEAYAVYYSVCVKWRYYLSLNKTIIHTDHRNLSWLFAQAQKGMIGRWYAHLCAYDLDLTYVQGKTQVVADPLSRLLAEPKPCPTWYAGRKPIAKDHLQALTATLHNPSVERASFTPNGCLTAAVSAITPALRTASTDAPMRDFDFLEAFMSARGAPSTLSRAKWAHCQRKDPFLGPIYKHLQRSPPPNTTDAWVRKAAQSYAIRQEVLHYRSLRQIGASHDDEGWVVAVPHALLQSVIAECHDDSHGGHHGALKTTMAFRQRYYAKGARAAIRRYINACVACKRAKLALANNQVPLSPTFAPDPFNAIAIDLYKPGALLPSGYRYVLTVVDMCTRWVQFIPLRSKFAAEVMLALCHCWFAVHGVPEFILSDKGKEFMGIVATLCRAADIKQIKTTPGHPKANGLCEVQHKTLTRELRIRSARPSSPTWADLLPEIQFAFNVSVDTDTPPGISPFQLVYGRRPRLAGKDITFPAKVTPAYPISAKNKDFVDSLCRRLQHLRLAALDRQHMRKQRMRDRHDKDRPLPSTILPKRGDLVYLHVPTTTPKLRYQWSSPTWLVRRVHTNTCVLYPLVSPAGRKRKPASLKTANLKKVRVAGPTTTDFWVGAVVRRKFADNWFLGTVAEVVMDEGKAFYQVQYSDFDQDEIDKGELWDSVIYHPRLDLAVYTPEQLPELHEVVMFTLEQKPSMGKVVAIDQTATKPITVELWEPDAKVKFLHKARFKKALEGDQPVLVLLNIMQIKAKGLTLVEGGHLSPTSQKVVKGLTRRVKKATALPKPKNNNARKARSKGGKTPPANKTRNKTTSLARSSQITSQTRHRQSRYNLRSRR